jgi:hypothetical protein
MRTRSAVALMVTVSLAIAFIYRVAVWGRTMYWRNLQATTTSDVILVSDALHRYRERYGYFPEDFMAAIPADYKDFLSLDAWRRPYSYRITETGFLLISYGRDGQSDGRPRAPLADGEFAPNLMEDLDADVVMSENGFIQKSNW